MSSPSADYFPLGLFLFNSSEEGISRNYDDHAKIAIRSRLGELVPRVLDDEWNVLSGDILLGLTHVRVNIQNIMSSDGCNSQRLHPDLLSSLRRGNDPGYVPYLLGIYGVPLSKLLLVDNQLKHDEIAGYRGLAMFGMNDVGHVMELGSGLALPVSKFKAN